jgi:serine/threonine protein kinase
VINGQEDILIKIIDFGLAVQCEEKEIVRTEKVIGTPQYLAPENIMGIHTLKSDIWCCGIIMYAILKGNTPFRASTKSEVLIKIQRESVNLKSKPFAK